MATAQLPLKQKAWLVVRRGLPKDAVVFSDQVDVPSKLAPGEVLVKVQAAAFNPVGYKLMGMVPTFMTKRPHAAEHDFAGIIVNGNGTKFENGQEVYGQTGADATVFKTGQGALAEYLVCSSDRMVLRPANLKPTEAAGLTLVGLTAYQALFNIGKLEQGQSVFINGGGTSVGLIAIQLAKATGCVVGVSASAQKEELMKSLGVDTFIDYKKGPPHTQLEGITPSRKYNLILEAVGNTDVNLYTHSNKYLAAGGIFISVGPHPHSLADFGQALRLIFETMRPRFLGGVKGRWSLVAKMPFEDLDKFAKYVADGQVKPIVDSVFAFEDVYAAYDRIISQRTSGKVVVKVDPSVE